MSYKIRTRPINGNHFIKLHITTHSTHSTLEHRLHQAYLLRTSAINNQRLSMVLLYYLRRHCTLGCSNNPTWCKHDKAMYDVPSTKINKCDENDGGYGSFNLKLQYLSPSMAIEPWNLDWSSWCTLTAT